MKVLIVGSCKLPVPAVKGGAVPKLIEELIVQQQTENRLELTVCSLWDEKAAEEARKYSNTNFIWAKAPKIVLSSDGIIRWTLKNIVKKGGLLSLGFVFQVLWFAFFVSDVLARNDYDAVIFENSIQMLSALKFHGNRKKYSGKYYIHIHSIPRKFVGGKKEFADAAGIICVSEFIAKVILDDPRAEVDPSKIRIMYNCIDTDAFRPHIDEETKKSLKAEYGIPENRRLIVFAGRICREKGIEVLLNAVRSLKREDVLLLIVGSNFYKSGVASPYEEQLRITAEDVKDRIVFTGYIDYSNMPSVYSIADVVVLPSLCEEGGPMTVLESMACGCAVITAPSGGIPEYVGRDNCIIVQKDEKMAENLAFETERILSDGGLREQLEKNAAKQMEKYNIAYYYRQLLDIVGESRS